ncbi:MAG TPA: permease-like cell division protein FtsX [Candidatus Paceibacterota bacterium]|nr:permease-like cell division protein FtsX [Candidatus Paceibacterota bacterium]
MHWTAIRRVSIGGAKNFVRSGAVSFATVLIMTVTLGIIAALIFLSGLLNYTLVTIRNKVDISVYFVTTAASSDILALKHRLEQLPQVASITYTSRDQALADFRARHANDQLTLQALDELGTNPLDASLSIQAKDPSQYSSIANFLSTGPALSASGVSIIDRVNYQQNKTVIDRLSFAMHTVQQVGAAIVLLFALASVTIAFATIRLAIYTSRDEIAVMRLVGASNAYIRGPFIVAGVIAGLIAAAVVLLLLLPASWYVGQMTTDWFGGFNFFTYYVDNLGLIFLILFGSGLVLGGAASFLAIRRYLTV